MKRPLKIVSIDGTRGAGKTSQIRMLSSYFKSLGMVVSTLKAGDNANEGLISLRYIESFLNKGEDHVVILDGSIARPMVSDLIDGASPVKIMDSFKDTMYLYETINQKYKIVGILLVMDDLEEIEKRNEKKAEFTNTPKIESGDLAKEKDIISGMRTFNNHIASKNISFHVINIDPVDSIISINQEIISHLEKTCDLPVLKKSMDDW